MEMDDQDRKRTLSIIKNGIREFPFVHYGLTAAEQSKYGRWVEDLAAAILEELYPS